MNSRLLLDAQTGLGSGEKIQQAAKIEARERDAAHRP
jgi:hypothetical protein